MSSYNYCDAQSSSDQSVESYINNMTDTIFITYTDSSWSHEVQHRDMAYYDFSGVHAKDLSSHVSYLTPTGQDQRYEKIVVIKEDDAANLRTRIADLLKHEDCKLVSFGVFTWIARDEVIECFVTNAKACMKQSCFTKALGRIWSLELNGSGKGCGVIAADDKIHVWRDR